MNRVLIMIASLMLTGVIALTGEPAQEKPTRETTFQFQACRDNCQEFYNLCAMRCPRGSYYYMACNNDCIARYGECFGRCQQIQEEQALRAD